MERFWRRFIGSRMSGKLDGSIGCYWCGTESDHPLCVHCAATIQARLRMYEKAKLSLSHIQHIFFKGMLLLFRLDTQSAILRMKILSLLASLVLGYLSGVHCWKTNRGDSDIEKLILVVGGIALGGMAGGFVGGVYALAAPITVPISVVASLWLWYKSSNIK